MQVKPNQTYLTGRVTAIRPQPDGWGAEVDIAVSSNDTPSGKEDFVRPEQGQTLTVFAAKPDDLSVGTVVRAEVSLAAGPTDSRVVLRSAQVLGS